MRNEKGGVVLILAVLLAGILIAFFYNASSRMTTTAHQARKSQGMIYAHQISANLAQKIRRSYDLAKAVAADPTNLPLCQGAGGAVTNVGTIPLCVFGGQICTFHPARTTVDICLRPGTTLVARSTQPKFKNFVLITLLKGEPAFAGLYSPPAPTAGEALNTLTSAPACLGGNCALDCAVNAVCLNFKFCPLAHGNCLPNEIVNQTIGFPKL